MMIPNVGMWYRDVGGAPFEVVAIDDDIELIEIQYLSGTVEEMDYEAFDEAFASGDIIAIDRPAVSEE